MAVNIVEKVLDARDLVLATMHFSEFDFRVTGSHFFGTQTPCSDVDFFTEASVKVGGFLRSLGFQSIGIDAYDDKLTKQIYRHQYGIDVQLCSDVELKSRTQDMIYELGNLPTDKLERTQYWNRCIDFVVRNLS